ncbi:MAG: type II toxin-antitoxin system prevent-host-death family antitoxin [Planctomycetota bacterium]
MTTTVGVRQLKNSLSRYLRLARNGESIVVCDHGRPVAILSPAPDGSTSPGSNAEHLAGLAARGLVTLGTGVTARGARRAPRTDLSRAVIDDREDRA